MSQVEEVLAQAMQLADEGEWDGMAILLAQGLEDDPDNALLLCWLGTAEQALGNEGEAYERFKQALAQQPEDPALLAMAGAGLALFDDPEAEGVLRTATILGPELPEARLAYGAYLSREGFLPEAVKELEAARVLAPEDSGIATELGVTLALKGDLDAAAELFDDASRMSTGDPWPQVLLGLVLLELNRTEEAAGQLTAAARAAPEDAEAQLLAALAAAATGWDDLAAEMLERGRQTAGGPEASAIEEADDRILDGADAARELLLDEIAPQALHRRLMARP
jgi:tetratricopeptide (TPR) repeat protein